jgi:hypothetical protein
VTEASSRPWQELVPAPYPHTSATPRAAETTDEPEPAEEPAAPPAEPAEQPAEDDGDEQGVDEDELDQEDVAE